MEQYKKYNQIPDAIFNKLKENFNKDNSKIIEKNIDKISKCKVHFKSEKNSNINSSKWLSASSRENRAKKKSAFDFFNF